MTFRLGGPIRKKFGHTDKAMSNGQIAVER